MKDHNSSDYFLGRKKLAHFACKHAKKIFVEALEYTHQVGDIMRCFSYNLIGPIGTPS